MIQNHLFDFAVKTTLKYIISNIAPMEDTKKVTEGLNALHKPPAMILANKVKTLLRPVKKPIAVAVSFLSEMFVIHAFATLSVAEAYIP